MVVHLVVDSGRSLSLPAIYKTLQTAVGSNLEDDEFFKKCIGKIEKEQKWFITAEALFFQNCSIGMY